MHAMCILLGFGTRYIYRHVLSLTNHFRQLLLRKGLWVRMAREVCSHAYCEIRPDVVEHPGTFGILYLTYYVLGLGMGDILPFAIYR